MMLRRLRAIFSRSVPYALVMAGNTPERSISQVSV
jgi:hypothetical protein